MIWSAAAATMPWMPTGGPRRRLAPTLACVAIALFALRYLLPLAAGAASVHSSDLIVWALLAGFTVVGLLVASRQPGNAIGWIFLGVAVSVGLSGAARGVCAAALRDGPDDSRLLGLAAMYADASWIPFVLVPATLLLLLFPDGHLPSRRWRWVARCAVAGMALGFVQEAAGPREASDFPAATGSLELDPSVVDPLSGLAFLLILVAVAGALAAIVVRYRRGEPLLRLQVRWLAAAGALVALVFPTMLVLYDILPDGMADAGIMLSVLTLPIAAGVAILRYRLYDIDVVINRALVYGGLTAALGAVYAASVLLLQLVLAPSSSELAIAASTLAVAALFRPLRARLQQAVDRHFFRRRYDAQRTLEAFAVRLRDEVPLEAVEDALRGAVHDTVAPAHAGVWLRPR